MTLRSRTVARVYELGQRIAVGGMGEIYDGHSRDLDRKVAVKRVLKSDDAPDLKALFLREVAVAATLEHPNVVEVFDAGVQGGDLFLVMEFVDGPSLAEVLEAMRRAHQLLPIELTFGLLAQIARGLAHAHERSLPDGTSLGILHRDVAPENVLITRTGLPKLADFGLATLEGHDFTTPGTIRGRPRCLSPEQARGDHIDVRSDVFALGAMMFELVSGLSLYPNEPLATLLWKVAAGEYESIRGRLPNADPDLIAILENALAVDPAERFRSAREFERALDAFRAARGMRVESGSIARLIAKLGVEILRIRAEKKEEMPGELEGRKLVLAPDRADGKNTGDIFPLAPTPPGTYVPGTLPAAHPGSSGPHPPMRAISTGGGEGSISGDLVNNPFYDAPTRAGPGRDVSNLTPMSRLEDVAVHLFERDAPESEAAFAPTPRAVAPWESADEPRDSLPPMPQIPIAGAPPPMIWLNSSLIPKPESPQSRDVGRGDNEVGWLVFLGIVLLAAAIAFAGIWTKSPHRDEQGALGEGHGLLVLPPHRE